MNAQSLGIAGDGRGRAHLDYSVRTSVQREGFDPDVPIAGWYRLKLVSGGVFVAVKIWFGAPLDPIDGTELDRAPRWQATANGEQIDLGRVWPKCAAEPIDQAEAEYLIAAADWAKKNAPDSAFANPRRRINPLTAAPPF
ncbi:hypothetical protein [Sphingomonas sp. 10B4]|uniref:hypothetical protein n=1 Tax=Sphingomonas sp. 10B4 TaxID=3048575 RepID=UPI002AB3F1D8|nr:hypothetical protein [Sphingomonas sp. 10B4]MDY7525525.1 hypothetical protein [Sphingomonas sp. 10B4]MEB0281471.1 hypothetical protein [Sphingomonas sp. 10B4]